MLHAPTIRLFLSQANSIEFNNISLSTAWTGLAVQRHENTPSDGAPPSSGAVPSVDALGVLQQPLPQVHRLGSTNVPLQDLYGCR